MNRGVLVAVGAVALGAVVIGAGATPQGRQVARQVAGRVGRFFTWAELTASATARRLGLDNAPTAEARAAMEVLVAYVLDPLRAAFGPRLRVTSGYRSPAVNEAVDGAAGSQHLRGEAVDLVVDGLTAEQVAAVIERSGIWFDQVIAYAPERGGHMHVSVTARRANRREVLWAATGGGYLARGVFRPGGI